MPFGIALAGGGTRGAAHVGVLCALEENGMFPSSIAGTSAGSVVAGLYASGVTCNELTQIVRKLAKNGYLMVDPDYIGILKAIMQFLTYHTVTLSGFIKGNKLETYFNKLTKGISIRDVHMKIVIPAVDLNSGLTIAFANVASGFAPTENIRWKSDVVLSETMRASIAVPTVFRPKNIGDFCLVDGGVTDNLPVNLLIAAGESNVLAVDISEFYKVPQHLNILEIASHSLSIMNNRLRNCAAQGEKLLLKPSLPEEAGLLTFHRMVECMELGYEATIKMLPAIKKLFS